MSKTKELTKKQLTAIQKELGKAFSEIGPGSVELTSFDIVYCYPSDKFVSRHDCHFCRGLGRDYSDSQGTINCSCTEGEKQDGWTLKQLISHLEKERERIRKDLETHKEDDVCNCKDCLKRRAKNWRKLMRESEQMHREMSRVSFEDMHRPFTI
jgi:hypothetical protein